MLVPDLNRDALQGLNIKFLILKVGAESTKKERKLTLFRSYMNKKKN